MMKFRIYPIIILAIFLLAIFLPKTYKEIFSSKIDRQRVVYSPVEKDFIKISSFSQKNKKTIYTNLDGTKEYSLDEYKSKLPFRYYYDLLKTNNFPEEFMIYSQNINSIKSEKSFIKIKPTFFELKGVNLYPLFESKPKYSGLSLPDDLFRLDENGITFIISATNKIDEEKTKFYNELFLQKGASFPLKELYGTPSTNKAFDEGYFISDAKNQLFHLKLIEGTPHLNKIDLKGIDLKFALIKEDTRKEYYGVLVDKNSDLYLMMYDDYELVKLPIDSYDYNTKDFKITTTPINRIIEIVHIDEPKNMKITKTYVTNLDYEIIKENSFEFVYKGSAAYESIKSLLFPFRLVITNAQSAYYNFEIRDLSKSAFIINLLLALCLLIYVKLSKREILYHFPQAILLALGGIYSLISLILFNKLLEEKPYMKKGKK